MCENAVCVCVPRSLTVSSYSHYFDFLIPFSAFKFLLGLTQPSSLSLSRSPPSPSRPLSHSFHLFHPLIQPRSPLHFIWKAEKLETKNKKYSLTFSVFLSTSRRRRPPPPPRRYMYKLYYILVQYASKGKFQHWHTMSISFTHIKSNTTNFPHVQIRPCSFYRFLYLYTCVHISIVNECFCLCAWVCVCV